MLLEILSSSPYSCAALGVRPAGKNEIRSFLLVLLLRMGKAGSGEQFSQEMAQGPLAARLDSEA